MAANDFWNGQEQYDLDENGQYKKVPAPMPQQAGAPPASPFDASKVPGGIPVDWAQSFIQNNPGDYHRIQSAYGSNGSSQPQTPTQQWNAQPAQSGRSDELYKLLMQRATQGTAVSRTDPNVRAQVDPAVAQQERASRSYLDQVAERSGPLANLQGERRLASERSGQAAGALEAEVIGREISGRRDEIAQALSLYSGLMSAEQQRALQMELAQLDAQLQREGLGLRREEMNTSNDQFLRELSLREWMAGDNSDRAWAGFGG